MQLSESVDGDGAVSVLVRVAGEEPADLVHEKLAELDLVDEVRCRRGEQEWFFTVLGDVDADPDSLLKSVGALVDQSSLRAEVVDVRRGADELPAGQDGYRISERFKIGGIDSPASCDVIRLDAAHVFGTGAHASTRLAVQAMEEIVGAGENYPAHILDVGTGSGILALVAARLGGEKVLGIDVCEEAISIARKNIAANDLVDRVAVSSASLFELRQDYDLVIANVTASVLLRLAGGIVDRLRHGSQLIVSGLQGRQGEEVETALAVLGLKVVTRYREGKWRCMAFRYGVVS